MQWPATSVAVVVAMISAAMVVGPAGEARAQDCNDAFCTPGIKGGVTLGAPCNDTQYYVFGTTSWGRLVFCGSPRRYEPRYFRSLPMKGVKAENSLCQGLENSVAQGFDGRYLFCQALDGQPLWRAKID
jgi:hypothetical protein